jgi:hypothetical protein
MPIGNMGDRTRSGASWLWRGVLAGAAAIGRLIGALLVGIFHLLRGIWRGFYWCVALLATTVKAVAVFVFAACAVVGKWIFRQMRHGVALCRRHRLAALAALVLLGTALLCWQYTGPLCWRYRCELSDFMHHLFSKQDNDTEHATWYYAVNVLFLPLQTLLLVVGGVYALLTLRQSSRFKQHDVEASCVNEYIAAERRMHEATTEAEMKAAARAYWALVVYEYHWWRQGLISRELFTVWSAYHMQKLKPNAPGFTKLSTCNIQKSFELAKEAEVFRSPSSFERLIRYLIARAGDAKAGDLKWHHIERFRHRWPPHF